MTPDFWQNVWQSNKIGFNQSKPNSLLTKYFTTLNLAPKSRVFVPLCGKSIDMIWLASQHYEVIGIELVETAVVEFFAENRITPTIHPHPNNPNLKFYKGSYGESHEAETITIWVGDIFDLTAEDIGQIAAIYDRAALVALPDDSSGSDFDNNSGSDSKNDTANKDSLRVRYTKHLMAITHHANQLLLTFSLGDELENRYDEISGPPFFIAKAKIYGYYDAQYEIEMLEQQQAPNMTSKNRALYNMAWMLKSI